MNQPLVQSSLYAQNYSLPTETDCIDQLGQATSISYSNGGVSESPRRNSELNHQPSALSRSLGHGASTNDPSFHPPPEQSSGSISTSPSSNNSSATYSYASSRPSYSLPTISNPYTHTQSLSSNPVTTFHLPNSVMHSRSTEFTNFLPSQRSGVGPNITVSPNGATSTVRQRYENLPGPGRYYSAQTGPPNDIYKLSNYIYASTDPTRGLPASISMPTTSSAYSPQAAQGTETPPFGAQENFYEIYGGSSGNELVKPQVEAKIEKGFFFSGDNCWTCYRRNYFAVQCSYTLTPHLSNQIHMLHHNGEHKQIQAMAMSLSARVNGTVGKPIELVQHTPKRDKGPQNPIKLTKLCPIPPGGKLGHLPHAESHFGHGLMGSYGSTSHIAAPYFPLQSQPDPDASQHDSGSPHSTPPTTPTAHQHTFERIQFKSATANNGKRRAQQQYYHLVVELHADIRAPNAQNAKWVKVAERVSSRVVVRGRSPSHYSNEGPNSTANRGGGAGAPGAGGYHGLGGSLSGTFGGSGFGNRSLSNYSLQNGVYRGNQYTMDPTPMSSHTVSSSSSVAGEPVDTFSMDHSSSMILTSQGGPDRLDFMQPPMTGLGLPPIFGSTLPRVKDESYFMSNRIPPVEISAVY